MRSGDNLGDAKVSKRAPRSIKFNFLLIAIDTNGFRRTKEEGLIYKKASDFLYFALGLIVVIFQNLVMILPRFFRLRKTITKSLGKN